MRLSAICEKKDGHLKKAVLKNDIKIFAQFKFMLFVLLFYLCLGLNANI